MGLTLLDIFKDMKGDLSADYQCPINFIVKMLQQNYKNRKKIIEQSSISVLINFHTTTK